MNILGCWTTAIFVSSVSITGTARLEDGGNVRFRAVESYLCPAKRPDWLSGPPVFIFRGYRS
jgi:hypothetical protein